MHGHDEEGVAEGDQQEGDEHHHYEGHDDVDLALCMAIEI